jgi:hypothetical protein
MGLPDKERELFKRSESERKHLNIKPGGAPDRIYKYWVMARGKPYGKRENLCHFFWVIVLFAPAWALWRGFTKSVRIGKLDIPIVPALLAFMAVVLLAVVAPRAVLLLPYFVAALVTSFMIVTELFRKQFDQGGEASGLVYQDHPALVPALVLVFLPVFLAMAGFFIVALAIVGVIKSSYVGLRNKGVFANLSRFRHTKLAWLTWYRFSMAWMLSFMVFDIIVGNYGAAAFMAFLACVLFGVNWLASTAKERAAKKDAKRAVEAERLRVESYARRVALFEELVLNDKEFRDFMLDHQWTTAEATLHQMFKLLPESLPDILALLDEVTRSDLVSNYEMRLGHKASLVAANTRTKFDSIKEVLGVVWAYAVYAKKAKACPLIELPEEVSLNEHVAA